ncbi:MAG TPA: LCP family protein [Solirubrobacteraceae bacterium]|jgi:LCP family protein required for cell wall assembly|nr:LCP family protein [Solirubrobacteraceae bacterium]
MSFDPATTDDGRPPSPARHMRIRFAIAAVALLLLSGGATATVALTRLNHIAEEVFPRGNQIHVARGVVETAYGGEPQTFMILGSDRRAGAKDAYDRNDPPHSDTLLLVHLDPNYGQISVLSIPRDLLVSITSNGHTYYPSKINAAYTIGSAEGGSNRGVELTAKTVEHLLHIKLNGVIDVSFKGFRDVVDTLGCVYVNVDHRYLHQSEATEAGNYSSINLQPGYQKLCYENALSYVRYRHGDSDFVRVARQQDFIRDLREQVPVGNLVNEIDTVSKAVGKAVTTTFHSSAGQLIELAKLAAFSQQKPLRQVKFQAANVNATIEGNSYVTSTPELVKATVREFLHGHAPLRLPRSSSSSSRSHSHSHHHRSSSGPSAASLGLYPVPETGKAQAITAAPELPFPLLYPTLQSGPAVPQEVHLFTLEEHKHRHHGYVAVWQQSSLGGYYDVEGLDWVNVPLFAHTRSQRIGSRNYLIVDDGSHIHDVGWRVGRVIYFVTNTLLEDLSNSQMIAIADSTGKLH